jgi:hypothetical protein
MNTKQYLNEVKATSIRVGNKFKLSNDLGKFKEGEEVHVTKISPFGDDIELHLSNVKGVKDTFYLDKNDDFEGII